MIATDEILNMTAPERLLLAQQLIDSVLIEATPLAREQIDEIRARAAAIDSGKALCAPLAEVVERLLSAA